MGRQDLISKLEARIDWATEERNKAEGTDEVYKFNGYIDALGYVIADLVEGYDLESVYEVVKAKRMMISRYLYNEGREYEHFKCGQESGLQYAESLIEEVL